MQTFLPYPDFAKSLNILDYRRLGKQRVEARQLLAALTGTKHGWANHPAALMWRGYEQALIQYGNMAIAAWVLRGYQNDMPLMSLSVHPKKLRMPPWFGDEALHASHRSNLLRKDFGYYSQFGWKERDDLPYVWPVPK